ncbi:MAG TPA: cytochrome c [Gemmatimonadales bacterium]|jgi:mono/diheme cytochrome c family protein|nr:cytochrome c [Gemmatimonadales bacterium]
MKRERCGAWLLFSLLVLGARLAAAQDTSTTRPAGVTDSAIAWGRALFHGSANCSACHGKAGSGTDAAPPLTGALWMHGPGTYEWLVEQIRQGIPAHHSVSGLAMPMRGWSNMNDDDVRAVAAYVWSITHPPRPPQPDPRPS